MPGTAPNFLFDGPADAARTIVLAHGAGAAMDTPFMTAFAAGLAAAGHRVARFEFPYMAGRRQGGKKRPPDRQPVLEATWAAAVAALAEPDRLVIGGKSMGGRMASLVADRLGVAGLICLGYPFHPPGRPERTRTDHLAGLETPTLILQGERDPLGNRQDVDGYVLSSAIQVHWLADGDHDLSPRKKSGHTVEQNWNDAIEAITVFLRRL